MVYLYNPICGSPIFIRAVGYGLPIVNHPLADMLLVLLGLRLVAAALADFLFSCIFQLSVLTFVFFHLDLRF